MWVDLMTIVKDLIIQLLFVCLVYHKVCGNSCCSASLNYMSHTTLLCACLQVHVLLFLFFVVVFLVGVSYILLSILCRDKRPMGLDAQLKLVLFHGLNTHLLYFTIRCILILSI